MSDLKAFQTWAAGLQTLPQTIPVAFVKLLLSGGAAAAATETVAASPPAAAAAAAASSPSNGPLVPPGNWPAEIVAATPPMHALQHIGTATIRRVLTALLAMARGNTAKELQAVLGIADSKSAREVLKNRFKGREPIGGTHLSLWVPKAKLRELDHHFPLLTCATDFTSPKVAAETINESIAGDTKQRITMVVTPQALRGPVRFVLVSASYLQTRWKWFDAKLTKDVEFHDGALSGRNVRMMFAPDVDNVAVQYAKVTVPLPGAAVAAPVGRKRKVRDNDDDEKDGNGVTWEFLKLPFLDARSQPSRWRVIYAVDRTTPPGKFDPTRVPELPLEHDFAHEKFSVIGVPSFEAPCNVDLVPVLRKLGVRDLFQEGKCDVSGLYLDEHAEPHKGDYISHFWHQCYIKFNEEGATAAAATVAVCKGRGMSKPRVKYVLDRPFAWYIVAVQDTGEMEVAYQGVHN
jgi:hypothetical protein